MNDYSDIAAAAQRMDMDPVGATTGDLDALAAPTPRDEVRQRPGPHSKSCRESGSCPGHKPLDYVDARFVIDRLNSIVPGLWRSQTIVAESGKVAASVGIFVRGIGWVDRWDGAGETDIEGEKGSFSDAFKRAAVKWGIARDLYPEPGQSAPQRSTSAPVQRRAEQAVEAEQSDSGVCPKHNRPWTDKGRGKFCSAKDPSSPNGWCKERP